MTAKDFNLSLEELQERFVYVEGQLIYKKDVGRGHKTGDVAGSYNARGYVQVKIKGQIYRIHRIIFFMHNGYIPKYLDHKDGIKNNNRIENLRPATMQQNSWNRPVTKNSISGIKGVYWAKHAKKWLAQGDGKHLGYFKTLEEAKICVEKYRKIHHGEFANDGNACTN